MQFGPVKPTVSSQDVAIAGKSTPKLDECKPDPISYSESAVGLAPGPHFGVGECNGDVTTDP